MEASGDRELVLLYSFLYIKKEKKYDIFTRRLCFWKVRTLYIICCYASNSIQGLGRDAPFEHCLVAGEGLWGVWLQVTKCVVELSGVVSGREERRGGLKGWPAIGG